MPWPTKLSESKVHYHFKDWASRLYSLIGHLMGKNNLTHPIWFKAWRHFPSQRGHIHIHPMKQTIGHPENTYNVRRTPSSSSVAYCVVKTLGRKNLFPYILFSYRFNDISLVKFQTLLLGYLCMHPNKAQCPTKPSRDSTMVNHELHCTMQSTMICNRKTWLTLVPYLDHHQVWLSILKHCRPLWKYVWSSSIPGDVLEW